MVAGLQFLSSRFLGVLLAPNFRQKKTVTTPNILGVAPASQRLRLRANACNPKINPILAEIKIKSMTFGS
jgi:hypothetical protein